MRGGEDLNGQCGRSLAYHSPHIFHHRVVKAGINFIDQKNSALGIRESKRKAEHSPHTISCTSDRDTLRNIAQLEEHSTRAFTEKQPPFNTD